MVSYGILSKYFISILVFMIQVRAVNIKLLTMVEQIPISLGDMGVHYYNSAHHYASQTKPNQI